MFVQPVSDADAANAYTYIHKLHLFNVKQIRKCATKVSLTKSIVANSANVNVHTTSISSIETTAVISNSTNNIIVSNPTA